MADREPEQDAGKVQPSLELPGLGWRRRRRAGRTPDPAAPEPRPEPDQTQPLIEESRPPVADEPERGPDVEPEPVPEPRAPRQRRVRGPGGMPVVLLTGVVVGLGIVGLTWASLRLCESVQGTSSCGNAGYGLLIAILVVMVVVGALLLRLARVPEPGSTSFLAVGLTSVLALVFLVDSLMDRPMVVVIPLISAATFALAHWVTRTFTGPARVD
ncbi:hypothetical protein [Nocardioides sp.]|uniref:hypothetical protein n=1 Tax=Nocardioides sp. TaxID=35761 RepID=UPI0026033911|nr:hypothetical protein [Nocardioides sp.]MDI6910523.1 hypothetical protein [Nocardioides sp.]